MAGADVTTPEPPEGRGAFGGFIGPRTLVGLVRNTAPFLFAPGSPLERARAGVAGSPPSEHAFAPLGYLAVIAAGESLAASLDPSPRERTEYFTLCLAAHFATVTTFVPTDVDTKIRDALWFAEPRDPAEMRRMVRLALATAAWDVSSVSARIVTLDGMGPVSGHDGERLSVLCGGLLACLAAGLSAEGAELEDAIDRELWREARAFDAVVRDGRRDRDLCVLAAHLTHNAGDVDQGLSSRSGRRFVGPVRERFGRLAHERGARYGGAFARAAAIYRAVMAPEGHRHYPLRELRALRADPALLLPVSPFLDEWGSRLATWPHFDTGARASIVAGLVDGCRKVKGQEGYFRALAGFERSYRGGISASDLVREMPASVRREIKDATLRQKVAVARESFESGLAKRARRAIA
jgi:hypothetical protein